MDLRILVTKNCDMSCKYCINNLPGVMDPRGWMEEK